MTENTSSSHFSASPIKVLLIEGRSEKTDSLERALTAEDNLLFRIDRAEKLATGLERIREGNADLIVLNLTLPDSQGIDTLIRLQAEAPALPVVVLTELKDENLGLEVIRKGAQDYVVKGEVDGKMLARILRHALERHRLQEAIRSLSFVDDLTGLYNRRGFLTIAEQHWMLSQRTKRGFLILFADLDCLKEINDRYGHREGDRALVRTAQILKGTFRRSDIIARIGGDEFAVLALDAGQANAQILTERLQETLKRANAEQKTEYTFSLSMGVVHYDSQESLSIQDLMAEADQKLYIHKHSRKTHRA